MPASVVSVHSKAIHAFSKDAVKEIRLIAGHGVEGDAHFGVTVKHRSRVAKNPLQPNLRQVHLIHQELLDDLKAKGLHVAPGQMGENITTIGIPLLDLSAGTLIHIGSSAIIQVTGLRNPCAQIENFMPGLLRAVLDRAPNGDLLRKAGIMGTVVESGPIFSGDEITWTSPCKHIPLQPV